MKKHFLLVFGLILFSSLSAQTYFEETFDTAIPATWQNIDNTTNGGGVWEWLANGGAGIALFNSDGYGNDSKAEDADLITPTIDCSAGTVIYLNIDGFFRQFQGSTGTVSVSNDDGATWTVVKTITADAGAEYIDISAVAASSATVKLKLNYTGDFDYYWVIDAIKVYTPDAIDASILSITNEEYVDLTGSTTFTGSIQGLGSNNITSFDLSYSVAGAALVTIPVSGVNIALGGLYTYTHTTPWNPATVGVKNVVVSVSNVNGGTDADMTNNATASNFTVYTSEIPAGAVQRTPLYEVFTSSTCGPCTPGNINFHTILDPKPKTEFVGVKYQQNFPSTGDPYATVESVNRRNYYAVNSIPRMEIDGGWDDNAASFTENLHKYSKSIPSYLELSAVYHIDQNTKKVTVTVNGKSLQDYATGSYKLQVAVLENETSANVKSNGETSFENVMKKMIPNENGTTISSLAMNDLINETLEYTFNGEYVLSADGQTANQIDLATEHSVEEFTDLSVIVWVEDATSKTVFQAAHAEVDSDNDGFSDTEETAAGSQTNNANSVPDDLDGDGYTNGEETTAGSDPNDVTSTPLTVGIKNVEAVKTFNVFPNPATDVLNVEISTNNFDLVSVELVDMIGKTIATVETNNKAVFNTSKITKGVYLVKVVSNNATIATSTVVVR